MILVECYMIPRFEGKRNEYGLQVLQCYDSLMLHSLEKSGS